MASIKELQALAIKFRTQFNFVFPDGSHINAGINPDQATTINLKDILLQGGATPAPKEFFTTAAQQILDSGTTAQKATIQKKFPDLQALPERGTAPGAPTDPALDAPVVPQKDTPKQTEFTQKELGLNIDPKFLSEGATIPVGKRNFRVSPTGSLIEIDPTEGQKNIPDKVDTPAPSTPPAGDVQTEFTQKELGLNIPDEFLTEGATVPFGKRNFRVSPTGSLIEIEPTEGQKKIPTKTTGDAPATDVTPPTDTPPVDTPAAPTPGGGAPGAGAGGEKTVEDTQAEIDQFNTDANEAQDTDVSVITDTIGKDVDVTDSAKLIKALVTTSEANKPERPDSVQNLASKRAELGIDPLEDELATLESDIERINTQLLVDADRENERLVSLTQIGKRKGKLQNEAERRIALLNVERSAVSRQLNNRLNTLNTFMQLTQQDFANASNQYNQEFDKALKVIGLFQDIEDTEQAKAQANLNSIVNIMQDSGKGFKDLTEDMKRNIQTLELTQGLPVGITEIFLQSKPDVKILSTTTGTDASGQNVVTFIYQDPKTGLPGVVKIVKTGSVTEAKKTTEEKEAEKQTQRADAGASADQIISDNLQLTDNELKQKLQDEIPGLTESEINTRVKNRVSDIDIRDDALELVTELFNPGSFKSNAKDVREAKADAIADIKQGGSIDLFGKLVQLTPEVQKRYIKIIESFSDEVILTKLGR